VKETQPAQASFPRDERPAARPCRCDGILTGNQAAECSESRSYCAINRAVCASASNWLSSSTAARAASSLM
jgi:hypothetical protein